LKPEILDAMMEDMRIIIRRVLLRVCVPDYSDFGADLKSLLEGFRANVGIFQVPPRDHDESPHVPLSGWDLFFEQRRNQAPAIPFEQFEPVPDSNSKSALHDETADPTEKVPGYHNGLSSDLGQLDLGANPLPAYASAIATAGLHLTQILNEAAAYTLARRG